MDNPGLLSQRFLPCAFVAKKSEKCNEYDGLHAAKLVPMIGQAWGEKYGKRIREIRFPGFCSSPYVCQSACTRLAQSQYTQIYWWPTFLHESLLYMWFLTSEMFNRDQLIKLLMLMPSSISFDPFLRISKWKTKAKICGASYLSLRKPQRLMLIAALSLQLKPYKGLILTAIWISASNPVVCEIIVQDSASSVMSAQTQVWARWLW